MGLDSAQKVLKVWRDLLKNLLDTLVSVDVSHLPGFLKLANYFKGLLSISLKPFPNDLRSIITAILTLGSELQSPEHFFLCAGEMQHEGRVYVLRHYLLPGVVVLEVAREAVDQEIKGFVASPLHLLLQQVYCDVAGNYFA